MVDAAPRLRPQRLDVPMVTVSRHAVLDERRGSAAARGYDSKWQKLRPHYLRKHPLCVCCLANDETSAAEVIDHVEPHRGDMVKFWDRGNWQGLCWRCHREIKSVMEASWDRGEIDTKHLHLDRQLPEFFIR